MVISASRRTDIPAFYGEWLVNRLRLGEVLVRNPFSHNYVQHIPLTPEIVDCIVFWTKNPRGFLKYLPEIDRLGYRYYFLFTLTPYDSTIETNVESKSRILRTFKDLSRLLGPDRVVWRYDPILLTAKYNQDYHVKWYRFLAQTLSSCTDRCIISFVEMYKKVRRNMKDIDVESPSMEMIRGFADRLSEIARWNKIELLTCSTPIDLSSCGIGHSRCIDDGLIGRVIGRKFVAHKDPSQRRSCGCIQSRDIGAYDTCPHGCIYCYANDSNRRVADSRKRYDPLSPLLCDSLQGNESIVECEEEIETCASREE